MTNDESIDYKALCWKLVDCMNAAWRKKTGEELSRDISSGVELGLRKKGSDVWHVNLAELAGRTVSGCKGLAFGEE